MDNRQIRIKLYGTSSSVREVTLETSKIKVREIILEAVETKNFGHSLTRWLEGSSPRFQYIIIADKKIVELDESLDRDVKEIKLRPVVGGG